MAVTILTPAQCRAARALLEWNQAELATKANVGAGSVRDFELESRTDQTTAVRKIVQALEDAGVVFIPGDIHAGEGVRFAGSRPTVIVKPVGIRECVLAFVVAFHGRRIKVRLTEEALEDLAPECDLPEPSTDKEALAIFESALYRILRSIAAHSDETLPDGVLYLKTRDIVL